MDVFLLNSSQLDSRGFLEIYNNPMNMFKKLGVKSAVEYIESLSEPRKSEIEKLHKLILKTVPKLKPYIETGMLGYGKFHYKSRSGREGDWAIIGLASQKNYISIYVCAVEGNEYIAEKNKGLFPKASIGKSCIRIKRTEDIDLKKLAEIFKKAEKTGGFPSN